MSNYYNRFATVGEDGIPRLSYGDGRGIRVGETLTVEGVPALCEYGLHASARILDALKYISQAIRGRFAAPPYPHQGA